MGYPDPKLSRKKAEVAVTMLLAGCTDERLAGFTAESLAASYNVAASDVARMLADARRRRGL